FLSCFFTDPYCFPCRWFAVTQRGRQGGLARNGAWLARSSSILGAAGFRTGQPAIGTSQQAGTHRCRHGQGRPGGSRSHRRTCGQVIRRTRPCERNKTLTSPTMPPALLVLEDGTVFSGI